MKFILLTLTAIALLGTTGCMSTKNPDHADNQDRLAYGHHEEHPGDLEHEERR